MMPGVAIVGGGPAGMTLALALRAQGVTASIYEARPRQAVRQPANGHTLPKSGNSPCRAPFRETLMYSVWRPCFTFFETVEDGRTHSCLKKDRALPNEITARFQEAL